LVDLLPEGHAFLDAFEGEFSGEFRDDHRVVGIPLEDHLTFLHLFARLRIEHRPIGNVAGGEYDARVVVHDAHFGTTADDHFGILAFAAFLLHRTEFIDLELTVVLGNDLAVLGDLAGHTTHVERTQGKLCARFPDGLCSDHAHSFTDLDHASGGQVASV